MIVACVAVPGSGSEHVSVIARRLERVDSADSFHLVALPGLAEVVPADLWGFNAIDAQNRTVRALTWPDIVPEPHHRGIDAAVWEHPVLQHFLRSGV